MTIGNALQRRKYSLIVSLFIALFVLLFLWPHIAISIKPGMAGVRGAPGTAGIGGGAGGGPLNAMVVSDSHFSAQESIRSEVPPPGVLWSGTDLADEPAPSVPIMMRHFLPLELE